MADNFKNETSSREQLANRHWEITPSDTVDIDPKPRTIYCAEAGTAQIADAYGTALPYAMTAGQWIPFRGVRINETDTTGTFYAWE